MLKFWPSTPVDLTPRAAPNGQERQNPFEAALAPQGQQQQYANDNKDRRAQQLATPTTPTTPAYHHQLLNTPHHLLSPSISAPTHATSGTDPAPQPHALASGPLTPSGISSAATALPTTSLSLHAPVFNMQQPPPPKHLHKASSSSTTTTTAPPPKSSPPSNPAPSALTLTASKYAAPNGLSPHTSTSSHGSSSNGSTSHIPAASASNGSAASSPSRGQIHVKLIQARGLHIRTASARPYVVVQFEQNEFVSREPIDESEKEIKGTATNLSRNSSSTALYALGALNNKVNRPTGTNGSAGSGSDSSRGSTVHTPSSSVGSGKSGLGVMFGSRVVAHNPVWKHEVAFDVTSEQSAITLNVYDRASEDQGFLGTLQVKPVFVHEHTLDHWYKLKPYDNETVTGEIRVQITFEASKTRRALTPRDFEFLKLIGRGTFGKVFQVRKKDTKRIYAMKILSKREIIAKKEVAHTIGERKILQRSLESPFLVGLKFSFQTDTDLYLVTDFKSGGELFWHLQRETRFSEERARFYIAELVLALEHLHKYDIVYRDLKPENILLDATGHVALCDFGLSKPDLRSDELTNTFCGTTEYLAPEVLLDEHGYSKLVDFWSLGVLLFEMCCGWSPFYAEDTQQMYKNICFGKIRFPKGVINDDGKQFVKGLLNRNPKHRLGAQRDAAELKEHPFFKSIDWDALARKQVTPPFKPVVESDESVANFDPEFTTADVKDAGPVGVDDLDEEDPSEDWVALSQSQIGTSHTPNGPLGSDKPPAGITGVYAPSTKSIEVPQKKKKKEVAGTPLTNSVQENFRGFTYHGESVIPDGAAGVLSDQAKAQEEEAVEAESDDRGPEEDLSDSETPAGRYAKQRRGLHVDGFDDDLGM